MKEIAILMAAGLGQRMRPLTESTAKPLLKVGDKALVETVIDALRERGVSEIYIVVGYKKEQFAALAEKYPCVRLVENADYAVKNNINSIAVAAKEMASADCFVCEADLFVSDRKLLCRKLEKSGYFGKMVKGHSDDWVFGVERGRIVRVGKGGDDCYNMVGVSYFKQGDAKKIAEAVCEAVKKPDASRLFWDEVVDGLCRENLDLVVHEVGADEIVECDTVRELEELRAKVG